MKVHHIISENNQVVEAPGGNWAGNLMTKVASKIGTAGSKAGAQGKLDANARAKDLWTAFNKFAGQTGVNPKAPTKDEFLDFMATQSMPTGRLNNIPDGSTLNKKDVDKILQGAAQDSFKGSAGQAAVGREPAPQPTDEPPGKRWNTKPGAPAASQAQTTGPDTGSGTGVKMASATPKDGTGTPATSTGGGGEAPTAEPTAEPTTAEPTAEPEAPAGPEFKPGDKVSFMSKAGKETVATVKGPSETGKESEVSVNTGKQNFNISKTKLKPVSDKKPIDPTATDPDIQGSFNFDGGPQKLKSKGPELSKKVTQAISTVKGAGLKVSSADGAEL